MRFQGGSDGFQHAVGTVRSLRTDASTDVGHRGRLAGKLKDCRS